MFSFNNSNSFSVHNIKKSMLLLFDILVYLLVFIL